MSGPVVETLTGTASPAELGITAMREHLVYGRHGWQWAPDARFDRSAAFEATLRDLEAFRRAGGRTLVDASGITLGRNVPLYKRLAEVSGVNIVASTGFHDQASSIPGHFLGRAYRVTTDPKQHWQREIPGHFYSSHGESMEYLMFLFYNELTEGMAAPGMVRTPIKAGIVNTGSAPDEVLPLEAFSIRGAAMAARHAGASVMSTSPRQAERHFELMRREGLDPGRIVIGHCDDARSLDPARDRRFAEQGACVSYDHVGWQSGAPHALPDERRAALVKDMVAAGFAEHVLLSCSAVGCGIGMPKPSHGYAYLLSDFVPLLKKAGVAEDAIETMLVKNPARVLAMHQDEESAEALAAFAQGFREGSNNARWDV